MEHEWLFQAILPEELSEFLVMGILRSSPSLKDIVAVLRR